MYNSEKMYNLEKMWSIVARLCPRRWMDFCTVAVWCGNYRHAPSELQVLISAPTSPRCRSL